MGRFEEREMKWEWCNYNLNKRNNYKIKNNCESKSIFRVFIRNVNYFKAVTQVYT